MELDEKDQVVWFLKQFHDVFPPEIAEGFDKANAGIGAVMKFLYEKQEPVTAGAIAEELGVSTARVAVILKNMENKELIRKTKDEKDRRITRVELTESGQQAISKHMQKMDKDIRKVFSEIGRDKIEDFFGTAEQIRDIFLSDGMERRNDKEC